jgi:hypothetical protein
MFQQTRLRVATTHLNTLLFLFELLEAAIKIGGFALSAASLLLQVL